MALLLHPVAMPRNEDRAVLVRRLRGVARNLGVASVADSAGRDLVAAFVTRLRRSRRITDEQRAAFLSTAETGMMRLWMPPATKYAWHACILRQFLQLCLAQRVQG